MTQHESEEPTSERQGLSELGQRVCAASAHALVGLEEEVRACLVAVLCVGTS